MSGPVYTYALLPEDEACGACPFADGCHDERVDCLRKRVYKLRQAERQATKHKIHLLETPAGRWLAESAGVEV